MKTLSLCLLAAGSLSVAASAQQYFEIYPGVTDFTSRGSIGTGSGEILQGFHADQNRGLGDIGGACALDGLQILMQDQDTLTPEDYYMVFRKGDDVTGPDMTPVGYLTNHRPIGPIPSPTGAGGIGAFFVTNTFATAVALPCEGFFVAGIELLPNAGYSSTDGISVHISVQGAGGSNQQTHASSVDMAWQYVHAAGTVTHPSVKRSWRFALCFNDAASFQVGNSDAASTGRYGNGGYFPNTTLVAGASQGLSARCTHPAGAAGTTIILIDALHGTFGFGAPLAIDGFNNSLYLQLISGAPIALPLAPSDGSTASLLLPGVDALAGMVGSSLAFQGLVVHIGGFDFTNAVSTTLLP